jgi:hypothetical protein
MLSGKQAGAETLKRQWAMLTAIPRAPRTVTVADLQGWLVGHGYEVTPRTIQRDLQSR